MENQRDEDQTGPTEDRDTQQPTNQQQNQQPEGQQQGQQPTDQTADQNRGGGMSGQPIGGNDSNTGSGTTLSAGYTPPSDSQNQGQNQGQSASGQTQTNDDTVTAADQGTGSGETPSGQSGGQSGGFVGSQGKDSSEYLQEGGQSQRETDQAPDSPPTGTDFANQGRGAPDEENEETIHSSAGGSASPDDGSGKSGGSF